MIDSGANSLHFKDSVLNELASFGNIAQFVSYSPALESRFSRVRGYSENYKFDSLSSAISELKEKSKSGTVNIRSFYPDSPKSQEFHYGLGDVKEAVMRVQNLAKKRLFTIVNETIEIDDGGVSGVVFGGVWEFAPLDTPRCVERPGTAELPDQLAQRLLERVYGFIPKVPTSNNLRFEFSIHPERRGYLGDHTILWEREHIESDGIKPEIRWPNRFSKFIGDKAYGLLIADSLGLPVPNTLVISRNVAPFSFGRETGSHEHWIRTCPSEQIPGKFSTFKGWHDPFKLMQTEDPNGDQISSILSQNGVHSAFSGAVHTSMKGQPIFEGVAGEGDEFMLGRSAPRTVPPEIKGDILDLRKRTEELLGPVRFEWAHDGAQGWIIQLHVGKSPSSGRTIFPGAPKEWVYLSGRSESPLEILRESTSRLKEDNLGVVLLGDFGVTSHIADVLRKEKIPSILRPSKSTKVEGEELPF